MKFKSLLKASLGVATAAFLFTGCGIKTSEYNVSADNNVKLRNLDAKIAVGSFTAKNEGEASVLCRLAETITTPQDESFAKYIENALVSELKMAGIYDQNADVKIKGHVQKVYGSSMLGNAYWEIVIDISSSNGKSFTVTTKREYGSAFLAYTACNNMGSSFEPTIKQLISDIISHPEFRSLIR